MSDIKIQPSGSGTAVVTLTAPATNTARTITFPDATGTLLNSGSTLDATKLSGALPALSGANLTNLPAASADSFFASSGLSAKDLGIGLHIKAGDSGASSINAAGNTLVLEDDGSAGITFLTGSSSNASIIFGDSESNYQGVLLYDHSSNAMKLITAGSIRMLIDSSGKVGIGTSSPTYALHVDGTSLGGRLMLENTANGNTGIFMKVSNSGTQVGNSTIRQENNGDISIYQGTTSEALRATFKQGKGLCFGTDTAAANALDDYEEGFWNPAFSGSGGSAGSVNYGEWEGEYTKIGRLVTVQFKITLSNKGSWSGEVRLTGLPFSVSRTMPHAGSCELGYVNYSGSSVGNIGIYVTSGVTYFRPRYTHDNDAPAMVQVSECQNTSRFEGMFSYTTNA